MTEAGLENFTSTSFYTNGSLEEDLHFRSSLKEACDVMTVVTLVLIILAVGADITFQEVMNHLRRPVAVVIGMFCQFLVMPLVGFTHITVLSLRGAGSFGVLLISCCPGGAVSNAFSYFLNADVPLSVTMTSLSTLLALGFMPLNLWIYGRWVNVGEYVIPYKTMATSLAFVTSPAIVGIFIRWKFPKAAVYITKVGSVVGFVLIALIITLENISYPNILSNAEVKLVVAVITMPSVGLVLGYCVSWVLRQNEGVRRTIAVESGIQNVAIAMGVLALSKFSFETQGFLMLFPMMYGISMISLCVVICSVYHLYRRIFQKTLTTDTGLRNVLRSSSAMRE